VPDREQLVIRRQLEHLHAAELPLSPLPLDIQDEIPVAHPGPAAIAEPQIGELAESLVLLGGFLQRWRHELAQRDGDPDEEQRRQQGGAGKPAYRDARRPDDRQLAASRQGSEAHQRADHGRQRQQLVRLRRQVQQREPHGARERVVANTDVVLLVDENVQAPQYEQGRHHDQDGAEDRPDEIAVQDTHAAASRCRRRPTSRGPKMKASASNTTSACVHHKPSHSGTVPRAIQTFAAETRLE